MAELQTIIRLLKARRLTRGTALWALLGGAALFLLLIVDIFWHLPRVLRGAALIMLIAGGLGAGYVLILRRALQRISLQRAARRAEEAAGITSNIIINWVQLRETQPAFLQAIEAEAARELARVNPREAVPLRSLAAPIMLIGLVCLLIGLLFGAFPRHFQTALSRLVFFYRDTAPITAVILEVQPGNAVVAPGESITVTALEKGEPVRDVTIRFARDCGEFVKHPMGYVNGRFTFKLNDITKPLTYRLKGGDYTSPLYEISVAPRPEIDALEAHIEFPPELKWPAVSADLLVSRHVKVPPGSAIMLSGACSRPLGRVKAAIETGDLALRLDGPKNFTGRSPLIVEDDTYVELTFAGRKGIGGDPVAFLIETEELRNPAVRFVKPGRNTAQAKPEEIPLLMEGRDLYGIRSIELLAWQEGGKPESLKTWKAPARNSTLIRHALSTVIKELGRGEKLYYQARIHSIFDRLDPGESAVYSVLRTSPNQVVKTLIKLDSGFRDKLRQILSLQKAAHRDTGRARQYVKARKQTLAAEYIFYLDRDQKKVYDLTAELLSEIIRLRMLAKGFQGLKNLHGGLMQQAVSMLELIGKARDNDSPELSDYLQTEIGKQEGIIKQLTAMLKENGLTLAEARKQVVSGELPDLETLSTEGRLEEILKKVKEFTDEEKEVIDLTKSLIGKDVDDLTEEEHALAEKLRVSQEKWSEFFQETADEIRKLMAQDFSDSHQADEFIEAYSEIEKAAEELVKGNYETAVPFEQAGAEKAEELTANLEKWLPDHRDNVKWVMEEPLEEYDVPMAELPEELDDLIGDLIDDLEDMTEDTEDVTSAWSDSLDEGAGWGVADGPISNMSAKGKTGNIMPNSNEVGGRSGEGRSGKSSGQFVEKTATGKGGRETPSRVTPDPYEEGEVKDTSGEQGGATGGGKKAGAGAEGLRGIPPPQVKDNLDRLSGRQADLVTRAEKLQRQVKQLHYNTKHLDSLIKDMKDVQTRMKDYQYGDFGGKMRVMLDDMRAIESYLDAAGKVQREKQGSAGRQFHDRVPAPDMENLPEGYEEMVKGYFKKLNE